MGERLTLNEAIKHAKEVADMNYNDAEKFDSNDSAENYIKANCMKCAEEHEQLAKWLEELKSYKNLEEQGLLVRLPCKVGTEVFCYFPGDSHYTKCQIKKNRNLSKHIWKYMLLCRVSCTKGTLLQIL